MSHDREFLDGLVTKVYEFGGGKVREHLGGIYDFLRSKQISELHELENSQAGKTFPGREQNIPSVGTNTQPVVKNQSYAEHKEQQKTTKMLSRYEADTRTRLSNAGPMDPRSVHGISQ